MFVLNKLAHASFSDTHIAKFSKLSQYQYHGYKMFLVKKLALFHSETEGKCSNLDFEETETNSNSLYMNAFFLSFFLLLILFLVNISNVLRTHYNFLRKKAFGKQSSLPQFTLYRVENFFIFAMMQPNVNMKSDIKLYTSGWVLKERETMWNKVKPLLH